jgi:hypothetical protein
MDPIYYAYDLHSAVTLDGGIVVISALSFAWVNGLECCKPLDNRDAGSNANGAPHRLRLYIFKRYKTCHYFP